MEYFRLPPADFGWETFQPPLYYVVSAGVAGMARGLGAGKAALLECLQAESLAISRGVLAMGVVCSRILFLRAEQRERMALIGAVAVFPALVFCASRISNDVLYTLAAFVWLAALLRFCRRPTTAGWAGVALAVGVGLITKSVSLAFIPISLAVLLLEQPMSRARKLSFLALFAGIVVLVAGWFQIGRALESGNSSTFVAGNIAILDRELSFDWRLAKEVSFDPLFVLRHPFCSPWAGDPHRDIFWEYFFKSAFFGEWSYPAIGLARVVVGGAMALLPLLAFGLVRLGWRSRQCGRPLALVLAGMVGAQLAWVMKEPFTCDQDIRGSLILVVPGIYFILGGIEGLPGRWKKMGYGLLWAEAAACLAWMLSLLP